MVACCSFAGTGPRHAAAFISLLLGACDPDAFRGRDPRDPSAELPDDADASDGVEVADAAAAQVDAVKDAGLLEPNAAPGTPADASGPVAADRRDAAPLDASASAAEEAGTRGDAALDAAAGNAAVLDAAPTDAGPPPPVAQSACTGAHAARAVCEGFETAPESPRFRLHATEGQLAHSTARTRVGIGALRASSTAAGGNAFVQREAFAKLKSGTLYTRSYLYIPSGPALETLVVHGFAEDPLPWGGVSVVLRDRGGELDVHAAGPSPMTTFVQGTATPIPRNRWFCLQFSITISDTAGSVQLAIDGKPVASESGLDTLPADGYSLATAGVIYTEPTQAPVEVYLDEWVADTKPIACD